MQNSTSVALEGVVEILPRLEEPLQKTEVSHSLDFSRVVVVLLS